MGNAGFISSTVVLEELFQDLAALRRNVLEIAQPLLSTDLSVCHCFRTSQACKCTSDFARMNPTTQQQKTQPARQKLRNFPALLFWCYSAIAHLGSNKNHVGASDLCWTQDSAARTENAPNIPKPEVENLIKTQRNTYTNLMDPKP